MSTFFSWIIAVLLRSSPKEVLTILIWAGKYESSILVVMIVQELCITVIKTATRVDAVGRVFIKWGVAIIQQSFNWRKYSSSKLCHTFKMTMSTVMKLWSSFKSEDVHRILQIEIEISEVVMRSQIEMNKTKEAKCESSKKGRHLIPYHVK